MIRKAFTLVIGIVTFLFAFHLKAQVIDIDGNTYQTVVIGNQTWMAENLKVTRYSNGDAIANVTDNATWTGLTTGAYCWYNNDYATNGSIYGALYNWYAASDSRNVCPTGWYVPTVNDWDVLSNFLGGSGVAGGKLKSTRTDPDEHPRWNQPNTGASNEVGFNGYPGGFRLGESAGFSAFGDGGYWWSTSVSDPNYSFRELTYSSSSLNSSTWQINNGYSIRCIKKDINYGLVAHYPFNNAGNDESGNGNTATAGNYIEQGVDRFGGGTAYLFNGTDDYFMAPHSTSTDFTGEISVCAWVNPSVVNIAQQTISSKGGGWNRAGWLLTLYNDKVRWHLGNGSSEGMFDTQLAVPANKWSFIVGQWKDGVMNVYINGIKDQNYTNWAGGLIANTYNHYIGKNDYIDFFFNGTIDDVRIYNRALSADEIKELYHEGNWSTVTDIDGNVYPTVKIGTQEWMAKNLKTTKYNNGEAIDNVTDNATWAGLTTGAFCWYNNDYDNYGSVYGALYNWYAVNDSRCICPTGWHVPSNAEWTTLETYLGGSTVAGGKMKEAGTTHWADPNTSADNSSGFTGLPGGFRNDVGNWNEIGNGGYFYTSTAQSETYAFAKFLNYSHAELSGTALDKRYSPSVRCIKNGEPPTLLTSAIQYATSHTAKAGGEVTADGGSEIYNRGIIWGYDTNLSETSHVGIVYDTGTGLGTFQVILEPLDPQTTYYYRSFAINSSGWGYGPLYSFNTLEAMHICVAIDNCDISYQNGGNSSWFGQFITTHDGADAAQSGYVIDNQNSYFSTTIAGPGELSFYWKASSQYNSDFLQFYVDGTLINQISGETDWYLVNHSLGDGSHSLMWQYTKDAAGREAEDCGWVDQIVYTQSGYPTVTTNSFYSLTSNTAMVSGTVTSDGGYYVSQRGVIWAAFENPSFSNYQSYTNNGEGTGDFVAYIDGLNANTTYYVRAYAINNTGTSYGNQLQFTTLLDGETVTDIDGNVYPVVTIGNQQWLGKNLTTTRYANGEYISNITDNSTWSNATYGAYCWYNNDFNTYGSIYGALYNWYAVNDSRNICPAGWHVPSDSEWYTMENFIDPTINDPNTVDWRGTDGGYKLKSNTGWYDEGNGNNVYGFSALPGGRAISPFEYVGMYGQWWTSSNYNGSSSWGRVLYFESDYIGRGLSDKWIGFSIRCIKNQDYPTVTTNSVYDISSSSANVSSTVTADNGYTVTQRGVVISSSYQNPTLEQNEGVTYDGTGIGNFTSNINGLNPNTTYYVRAYATNEQGTGYGNQLEFTTTEPGVYTIVFNVDLSNADFLEDGVLVNFDPEIYRVFISGNFGEGEDMWPEPGSLGKYELFPVSKSSRKSDPQIYSIALSMTERLLEYKFFAVKDDPTWEHGEWSGGANRGIYINQSITQSDTWGIFNASTTIAKVGQTIDFNNANLYNVSNWQWSFGDGANPSQYSSPGPVSITYSTMGPKTVMLYFLYFESDQYFTRENYITIGDTPLISNISDTDINYNQANISFNLNANWFDTQVFVEFGETMSLGNSVTLPDTYQGDANNFVSFSLDDLDENTLYYYRIVAQNALGEQESELRSFRTLCSYTITTSNPSGSNNVCAGATERYTTTSPNAETYEWEVTPASAATFSSTASSVNIEWKESYNGDAQIRVRGISGTCNSEWSQWLSVYVNVSVSDIVISGESTACSGSEVLYALSRNAMNYQWQVSGGGGVVVSSSNRSAVVRWNNTGSGIVRVVESGSGACPLVATKNTTVNTYVAPNLPEIRRKGALNILICTTPNMTYKWTRNNETLADASQYIVARNNLGTYFVQVKDGNQCPNTSQPYNLGTYATAEAITIFPNPNSGQFTLEVLDETNGIASITIANSFGKLVYNETVVKQDFLLQKNISISNLPQGFYIVTVKVDDAEPISAKLTVY